MPKVPGWAIACVGPAVLLQLMNGSLKHICISSDTAELLHCTLSFNSWQALKGVTSACNASSALLQCC